MAITKSLEDRFWAKVDKSSPNDCWLWVAAKDGGGYGLIGTGGRGKTGKAHRISWEMVNGPIPKGMCVCHTCDTPACVNPNHLWLGTKQENNVDKMKKGRSLLGSRHPIYGESHADAKLTEAQVNEIREHYDDRLATQSEIAEYYGVGLGTILDVVYYRTWKHL